MTSPFTILQVRDDISSYVRCASSEAVTAGSGQKLPAVRPGEVCVLVWTVLRLRAVLLVRAVVPEH